MSSRTIAVLGCGPSGLLAALACYHKGRPVAIFSRKEKSQLGGAQFLHKPIPEVADGPGHEINHVVRGTIEQYRKKVYGPEADDSLQDPNNVMPQTGETLTGWPLQATYDTLWSAFGEMANEESIDGEWVRERRRDFAAIISTIPATRLCLNRGPRPDQHFFSRQTIHIANEAIEPVPADNTIIFDCTPDRTWYRCASVFGHESTEWSDVSVPHTNDGRPRLPVPTFSALKPLQTNCNCHAGHRIPPNPLIWTPAIHVPPLLQVGRRGAWDKNSFTHHAYYKTLDLIGDL